MNSSPGIEAIPWRDPLTVFRAWQQRAHCVWLDSAGAAEQGISVLAVDPVRVIATKGNAEDPFALLETACAQRRGHAAQPFPVGAAIGYFGYDLKNQLEDLPAQARDDLGLPDCWFGIYESLLVFDHAARQLWRVGNPPLPAADSVPNPPGGIDTADTNWESNFTRDTYLQAVARAKEYIAAGDVYQVNLSQRFQCRVGATAPALYEILRAANPAPYCAYLDIGDAQVLSSSPECFLSLAGREAVTRPIKGTRPRARDPRELAESAKDRAELLMITDLERNDLGRVCEYGSVRVPELQRVESFATVHHLVATVTGRLRPEISHAAAVRACFPGGSITGAPKIRAMEIIDELEPHARGVYTGAIGFFGFNELSHFNIAIRTLVYQQGRLTFHAGGGIVADSEPAAEYEETLAKAEGILNAIDQLRLRQRPVCA